MFGTAAGDPIGSTYAVLETKRKPECQEGGNWVVSLPVDPAERSLASRSWLEENPPDDGDAVSETSVVTGIVPWSAEAPDVPTLKDDMASDGTAADGAPGSSGKPEDGADANVSGVSRSLTMFRL